MTIMIIQFVKDEDLPVLVWPPAHSVSIQKKISVSKTVYELRFCVLLRKRSLLLYAPKSFLRPVLACDLDRSRQKKPSHFAN